MFDYLIVGAGFSGCVLAERLASEANKRVLIVERRPHIGGNAYDYYNDEGLLVHKYGPHIFHTNSEAIFTYLSRFTSWRPYEHRVLASVDGLLVPLPINLDTLNTLYGLRMTSDEAEEFLKRRAEVCDHARTSEEIVVSKVGRELYEKFFKNYTRKQWGLDPSDLDASVAARVPIRTNRDSRYFTDTFQAMPLHGYTRLFERMLDHPNINILLKADYRDIVGVIPYDRMIYSGPIDEYFDYQFGKLPYRSLEFKHETHERECFQSSAVVNYPNEHMYTRVTEFKYLTGQCHPKTSIVYEYPVLAGEPYYPVPCPANTKLYKQYEQLARQERSTFFVGRLGTYKYYSMDQVVGQALATYKKLVSSQERDVEVEAYDVTSEKLLTA